MRTSLQNLANYRGAYDCNLECVIPTMSDVEDVALF